MKTVVGAKPLVGIGPLLWGSAVFCDRGNVIRDALNNISVRACVRHIGDYTDNGSVHVTAPRSWPPSLPYGGVANEIKHAFPLSIILRHETSVEVVGKGSFGMHPNNLAFFPKLHPVGFSRPSPMSMAFSLGLVKGTASKQAEKRRQP